MPPAEPVPNLDPLSRLAIRFGTDKFGGHLYTPSYHQILGHLREQPVRLLEIGVGGYTNPECGGSSLRMWAEYFPNGKITGLDINPKSLKLPPRVTLVQGSQDDHEFLERLSAEHGPFDIIIDDGSHHPKHMIASLWALYPLMNPDGIYIIEDTQTCFMSSAAGNPLALGTIYPFAFELALQMHGSEGYVRPPQNADLTRLARITHSVTYLRNVICLHRGNNAYPSNTEFKLADPAVAGLLATIEQQAANDPSPRNVLSRIDIFKWAGEFDRAAALTQAALAQYPDDLELLLELHYMIRRMPVPDVIVALETRIEALRAIRK